MSDKPSSTPSTSEVDVPALVLANRYSDGRQDDGILIALVDRLAEISGHPEKLQVTLKAIRGNGVPTSGHP